jgi:hypothetical protein
LKLGTLFAAARGKRWKSAAAKEKIDAAAALIAAEDKDRALLDEDVNRLPLMARRA